MFEFLTNGNSVSITGLKNKNFMNCLLRIGLFKILLCIMPLLLQLNIIKINMRYSHC